MLTRSISVIYVGMSISILLSCAGGLIFSFLRRDFGGGFSIASYVITCFSLAIALLAASDFLGMETPDSFAANNIYKDFINIEVEDRDFTSRNAGRSKGR
jgi:ABC-type uncharacterized transport system permease subunit